MAKLFKIVLDAGHGGKNLVEGSSPNNAVAPNGLLEKDLTLKIAQLVKEKLPTNQFQAFLTRDKDENLSLKQRANKSREIGADAFVSIHFNASKKQGFDGTEVFISDSSDEKDYLLAEQLLRNVSSAASVGKRGIREVDFTVLKGKYHVAKTAACLVEMAYLTNPSQAKNLSSPAYIDRLAAAVTQAIVNYTKQASYAQSLADEKQGEKLVAQFTKEHSDPKNFPIDLPEMGKGTDKFPFEIPSGLKMSRWEVEVLEASTGASYKVIKFPIPKSEGKQSIHIEWNHLPYGKIVYKLKVYASSDGIATPEKVYFNSAGWMEKSKDQIAQGIPFQVAVKGEKAKQIYEAIIEEKNKRENIKQKENLSKPLIFVVDDVIIIGLIGLGGLFIISIVIIFGLLTLGAVIKLALDKGYDVKDTKYKAAAGEGEKRQEHEIAFNITKPTEAKSQNFGLDVEFDSSHFESLEAETLDSKTKFDIKESVGTSGINKESDVLAVKKRLIELGFDWLKLDKNVNTATTKAIQLFQSIIKGSNSLIGDGLISVGKNTHRWLQAKNAPRWQTMSQGTTAEGFFNYELTDTKDTHDFGTDWIDKTIKKAAAYYRDNYLKTNPKAALLTVNDVSLEHGGDTKDHSGHECGLACDLQLPKTDGTSGGIFYTDSIYDQNAARGILQALNAQSNVSAIYFNDAKLAKEGLCMTEGSWCRNKDKTKKWLCHDNHIHFEIKAETLGEIETLTHYDSDENIYQASHQAENDYQTHSFDTNCDTNSIQPSESYKTFNAMLKFTESNHGKNTPNVYLKWNCIPKNTKEIDVVVHFHGFNNPDAKTINRTASLSGLDLSKRTPPTLCIMPLAKSEPDYTVKIKENGIEKEIKKHRADRHVFPFFSDKKALQNLIEFSLKEFAKQNNLPENSFTQKRLILTAHSGGGLAINQVLAHKTDQIDEVHLFDATYFGSWAITNWIKDSQDKPNSALRIIYLPMSLDDETKKCYKSGTSNSAEEVKIFLSKNSISNPRFRVERTKITHNEIPKTFGYQLLADAGCNLDDSNATKQQIHICWEKNKDKFVNPLSTQQSLAFYDENEVDYFADREASFRDF